MNEPYKWNYDIKIKTKEGTFEYEQETLENLETLLQRHPNYTGMVATHNKPKTLTKRRSDEFNNLRHERKKQQKNT